MRFGLIRHFANLMLPEVFYFCYSLHIMEQSISKDIIFNWLNAWSISRGLTLPTSFNSGFKVEVGYPNQKVRYVFPLLNEDFFRLANEIDEPYIYLKFCGPPKSIIDKIPSRWKIQPQGFMMVCFDKMKEIKTELSQDYNLKIDFSKAGYLAKIQTINGEVASEARLILVNDLAIYDRVITNDNHKRKGLASILIKELEKIAISEGVCKNFLVATEQGKFLYEKLGWKLYSLYTSVVIIP